MPLSRRNFLKISMAAGGGLIIGIPEILLADAPNDISFKAHMYVTVFPDNSVEIKSKNPEIGQGIKTALPIIIAEEMDVAWEKVSIVQAEVDKTFGEQFSGGSLGVRLNWDEMRKAGAAIRALFIQAAAIRWDCSITNCTSLQGFVINKATREKISYGELISTAKDLSLPAEVPLKKPEEYKIIGNQTIPANADIQEIAAGRQLYSGDIRLEGMLYCSIERAPFFEAQVESVNDSEAKKIVGVKAIITLNNKDHGGRLLQPGSPSFVSGVAVLATNTWSAFQGRKALSISWSQKIDDENSESHKTLFREKRKDAGDIVRKDGQAPPLDNLISIESTYTLPFLAHVTMEPMNCTAHVHDGICEIWAPTQNPEYILQGTQKILSLPEDKIKIHMIRAGGGFGRRYYADFCIDAVLLSQKTGVPVKVVWTREDDIHYDYFRPASLHNMKALLDKEHRIVYWLHKMVGTSRAFYMGSKNPPFDSEMDNYNFPAGFVPNLDMEFVHVPSKVPMGQWRGVGLSVTVFATHCFIDEVAHIIKKDPIEFYLRLLGDKDEVPVIEGFKLNTKRLRGVVSLAREKSSWNQKKTGIGYGFTASYNQGSFVALIATVAVISQQVRILKITAAIDCGLVVNPSGARAQVEGSIVEGLSATLFDKIEVENSFVKQSNFNNYRWIRMKDVPEIDVHFVNSTGSPRGLGEPVLPLVAPVICNAIFNACGKRLRDLPLSDEGFSLIS